MYFNGKKPDVMNWRLLEGATLVGKYDFPKLAAVNSVVPEHLIPFHQVKATKDKTNHWFHFWIDDYRFERFWNKPDRYLDRLLQCAGGFAPDYSVLLDQPRGQQVGNAYRNYALTYWLQKQAIRHGKQVIPNASFSDAESLDWILEPLPENSIIAVTSQGCMKSHICTQSFLNGLHELVRQKHPTQLIVYGHFPLEWQDKFPVPIRTIKTFSAERWSS